MDKPKKYCVGVSGGKDSTALILHMLFELQIPKEDITFNFCNTSWESPVTYKYLDYLRKKLDIVINELTIKVGDLWEKQSSKDKAAEKFDLNETVSFKLLAEIKLRFPSTMAKFCTTELKLKPTKLFYDKHFPVVDNERLVVNVSGIRKEESEARSKSKEWRFDDYFQCWHWLPIVDLSAHEVFALHKKYHVEPNPLYKQGAARVGCFPCIYANKGELSAMAKYYPERFDELAIIEEEVGATFFAPDKVPPKYCSKEIITKDTGKKMKIPTAFDIKKWALGQQVDLPGQLTFDFLDDDSFDLDAPVCTSKYGLCE